MIKLMRANGKFIRTILNIFHRIKDIWTTKTWERQNAPGFQEQSEPKTWVCQRPGLTPFSSPLWVFTVVSTTKNGFPLHGGKVAIRGAWVLQIVVPISREELTLFLSPFNKNPRGGFLWAELQSCALFSTNYLWSEWGWVKEERRWLLSNTQLELGKKQFPEKGNTVPGGGEGTRQKRPPRCAVNYDHRAPWCSWNKIKLILIYSILMSVCMQYLELWRGSKGSGLMHLQEDEGIQYYFFLKK